MHTDIQAEAQANINKDCSCFWKKIKNKYSPHCREPNGTFVKFLAIWGNSVNNLYVILCSCMSKWADVPEVALVSVA